MIAAPLLLVAGASLLVGIYDASGPELITKLDDHRARGLLALNAATAGTILGAIAIVGLAGMIARERPRLGRAGGTLGLIGMFGPGFFLGVYFAAAHLGGISARSDVGRAIDDTQSTLHVINLAGPCLVLGLLLLAVGAFRTGVLSRPQSAGLALAAVAPVGFISGVILIAVVAWAALAFALVPLGIRILARPA